MGQLVILVPTLVTTFVLGQLHVSPVQRIIAGLCVGMIAIGAVAMWQRGQDL